MTEAQSPWEPWNNGAAKRRWFVARADESIPLSERYHLNTRGDLIRYASCKTAQQAADKLNKQEGGDGLNRV